MIKDLIFIAENLDEEQLEEIFTNEKLDPLLRAILSKKSKRVFGITELFSFLAFQKLVVKLPNDVVNNLGEDIEKPGFLQSY